MEGVLEAGSEGRHIRRSPRLKTLFQHVLSKTTKSHSPFSNSQRKNKILYVPLIHFLNKIERNINQDTA